MAKLTQVFQRYKIYSQVSNGRIHSTLGPILNIRYIGMVVLQKFLSSSYSNLFVRYMRLFAHRWKL